MREFKGLEWLADPMIYVKHPGVRLGHVLTLRTEA
jgi:hypothetical protein